MAKFDFSGLNELEKELSDLEQKVETLSEGVPLDSVLTDEFMRIHTKYRDLNSFMLAAGGQLDSINGSWHFPDDVDLDSFVSKNSDYGIWEELIAAAVEAYL